MTPWGWAGRGWHRGPEQSLNGGTRIYSGILSISGGEHKAGRGGKKKSTEEEEKNGNESLQTQEICVNCLRTSPSQKLSD